MDRLPRPKTLTRALALLLVGLPAASLVAADLTFFNVLTRTRPPTSKDCPVERLAREIDWLEHQIETYGTVVAKQPDIWGEARLTKHRHEVERELQKDLGEFEETLQGAIRRSDESLLSMAFTLSSAANGAAPAAAAGGAKGNGNGDGNGGGDTTVNVGFPATELVAGAPEAVAVTGPAMQFGRLVPFGRQAEGHLEISLEPTVYLAQKARYLNYLNELRRINEGDDTADSPGYSLCLVRIPVSVLPGKKTFQGYGAEITVTAEPYLTDELLPETFRNLVVNDVVDQLSLPLTKLLHARWKHDEYWAEFQAVHRAAQELRLIYQYEQKLLADNCAYNREHIQTLYDEIKARYPDLLTKLEKKRKAEANGPAQKRKEPPKECAKRASGAANTLGGQVQRPGLMAQLLLPDARAALTPERANQQITESLFELRFGENAVGRLTDQLRSQMMHGMSSVRSRRSRLPYPPSQLPELAGPDLTFWAPLALTAYESLKNVIHPHEQVHLGDVRVFLETEVQAAYDFLSRDETATLWSHCNKQLVEAIRGGKRAKWVIEPRAETVQDENGPRLQFDQGAIADHRERLRQAIRALHSECGKFQVACDAEYASTAVLAWGIIVESALLNDRLMEDIRTVADQKGAASLAIQSDWMPFFLPRLPIPVDPREGRCWSTEQEQHYWQARQVCEQYWAQWPEACQVFQEYVRCRWPVVVFALDPVTDEQNVAELFSVRREMQLAAAVALAGGRVSPSAALNFVRRVETDVETIALNRTIVGFSHNADTFGWRFYPRLQTPPTVNGAVAFWETLTGGPTSRAMMHRRQLEPGMRECVAVMLLPSFVPYVQLDTRASWLSLNDPSKKELTLHDSMKISRTYQAVRQSVCQTRESCAYRPGDVGRLIRVVDQLERRLPMQTTLVEIPFENTLGGFEMFSSGVTDLGPELVGWYGAPGVRVSDQQSGYAGCFDSGVAFTGGDDASKQCGGTCGGTTLFLVGDNFSVHDTKVLAGGRCVPYVLMSRQVMRVTIPLDVNFVTCSSESVVDVHVATPYGVSRSLSIPVANPKPQPQPTGSGFAWAKPGPYGAWIERKPYPQGRRAQATSAATLTYDPANHPPEALQISTPDLSKLPKKGFFPVKGWLGVYVTVKMKEGPDKSWRFNKTLDVKHDASTGKLTTASKAGKELWSHIQDSVPTRIALTDEPVEISCTGYLRLDEWPIMVVDGALTVTIHPAPEKAPCASCGDAGGALRLPPTELVAPSPMGPTTRVRLVADSPQPPAG